MTARTFVSHAAAFLPGLLLAGGVGLWAVRQEPQRTAEALRESEEGLQRTGPTPGGRRRPRRCCGGGTSC